MVTSADVLILLEQRPPKAREQVDDVVRRGFTPKVVKTVAELYAVPSKEIEALIGVPATTLQRHANNSTALKARDSDRIYRMGKTFALAVGVLGNRAKAQRWFSQSNRSLNGMRPIELLDTEAGTDRVVSILMKIEHGIY